MIDATQMPERFRAVCDEQYGIYQQGPTVQVLNAIPDTTAIPIVDPKHWLRIPDVICVFVDMAHSTKLSATAQQKTTAGAYQLFTGTAVRLFDAFESPYIDVRGDGVFGLFNSNQVYRALAAAISFKTFAKEVFVPEMKKRGIEGIGAHIGIDQKTVLVRKIGLKRSGERTDRQNEVWAGKPVNMASKLASLGDVEGLFTSDRYFARIKDNRALYSCGCNKERVFTGEKTYLWDKVPVADKPYFDFENAWSCRSQWCKVHGAEFCEAILALDGE
jgi:class 3 adenylate cyclase